MEVSNLPVQKWYHMMENRKSYYHLKWEFKLWNTCLLILSIISGTIDCLQVLSSRSRCKKTLQHGHIKCFEDIDILDVVAVIFIIFSNVKNGARKKI